MHVADEVWQTCVRFLFGDYAGKRYGLPKVGAWWGVGRIPGRARSHTKDKPAWETYRLVGSLQGHLDRYGTQPSQMVDTATATTGASVLAQPK